MKFLKYTVIVIVVLIAGFFLLGIVKSEIAYDCEITANKPLAESWAVGQDKEKIKDWLEDFHKMEVISGTPGTVGAVTDIYFNTDGEEMTIRETITEIVPDESISMLFEMDFMNMNYTMTMKNVDGKTMLSGNLTLKEKKNNVTFPVTVSEDGNSYTITSEMFTIDRSKWDVQYGSKSFFDNLGDKFINDDIELKITVKASKS